VQRNRTETSRCVTLRIMSGVLRYTIAGMSPGAVATRHLPGVSCILNDPGINLTSPAGR
jgi:hypothetical protein